MSAWKASVPFFTVSMHTKKNSILTPFLANKLKKMAEFGITKIISKRHIIPKPNCKSLNVKGQPIGMEKIASLFVLYCTSCILSLIILVFEIIFKPSKPLSKSPSSNVKLILRLKSLQKELELLQAERALGIFQDIKFLINTIDSGNTRNKIE